MELDQIAEEFIRSQGAIPAFKHYQDYPASICTSINEVAAHGLPSGRKIKADDVVSIDVGVSYQGFITDAAVTICLQPKEDIKRLINGCQIALETAINACVSDNTNHDIAQAIQDTAKEYNLSVLSGLCSHGVGKNLHEDPLILHTLASPKIKLKTGMVLAIEPILTLGEDRLSCAPNGEFYTSDFAETAHFEKTLIITKDGPQILTQYDI